jgi:uncharacterized coiled-coil protein SlyX
MNQLTQSKNATILPVLIALTLTCFGLSPAARAVCREGCDSTHENTFLGDEALGSNTTGGSNVAIGSGALESNTTGGGNTATGDHALFANQTGFRNTANGAFALQSTLDGSENTATGDSALFFTTRGNSNTADGFLALALNTGGDGNTATGESALYRNANGDHNTAVGQRALRGKRSGSANIALGYLAGSALITGDNNIAIGNVGVATESNTIRIGTPGTQQATYVAGISGVNVAGGVGVVIDTNGQLGTMTSSARFKEAIEPMDKASEVILALQPVTFRYKQELDPGGIPQFGLVAEEVEKVNPDLVARDADGKPYTVRYEAVNAMLLNEFLKEHKKVEEQQATIAELKSTVAEQQKAFQSQLAKQQKQIDALTAGLQRVNAHVEMSRPAAPQMVVDNH